MVIEGISITLHKTHVLSEENVEFQIRASITEGYPQTILDSSVELSINSPSTNFMSPEISSCDHSSKCNRQSYSIFEIHNIKYIYIRKHIYFVAAVNCVNVKM